MSEAEWETADQLIAQAESQHVQFGKLHFGDTPEKARRDLEKSRPAQTPPGKQATAGKRGKESTSEIPPANHVVSPSSSTAQPGTIKAPAERQLKGPRKPAADQVAEQQTAPTEQAFPPTSKKRPAATAPARIRSTPSIAPPPAPRLRPARPSRRWFVSPKPRPKRCRSAPFPGRQQQMVEEDAAAATTVMATAVGDEARAKVIACSSRPARHWPSAMRRGPWGSSVRPKPWAARYDLHEDNPAKIEAAIQKQAELVQLRHSQGQRDYRRRQVDLLLSQAESLLLWKEFDDAERLANDAANLPVTYGPFDAKPQDLLNRVASGRRRSGRFRDSAVRRPNSKRQPAARPRRRCPRGRWRPTRPIIPQPTSPAPPVPAAHVPAAPRSARSFSPTPIRRGMCRPRERS